MKYYLPRPWFGYLLLSVVGATVFMGIVIAGYNLAERDLPDDKRMWMMLVGFCLSAVFFTAHAWYKRDRRDYVELSKGYIEWVAYEGKVAKTERIYTKDIRVFEITYFEGAKQPAYYTVIGNNDKEGQLEIYQIPLDVLLQYCRENNLSPLISTIRHLYIENIKINSKRIKIEHYAKRPWIWGWGKSEKILFTNISAIELISTHPISQTEDHYCIRTRDGKSYQFPRKMVKEDTLKEYATAQGIHILQRYQEREKV